MDRVADRHQAQLGAVQETLFIPLAARARAARAKRPVLRDPKAVELAASIDYDAAKYGRGAELGLVSVSHPVHETPRPRTAGRRGRGYRRRS